MLAYGRLTLLVAAVALLALFQIATSSSRARAERGDGGPAPAERPGKPAPEQPAAVPPAPPQPAPEAAPDPLPKPAPVPAARTVRVKRGKTLQLRARPRGKVVSSVGARTEFGSPTVLSVAAVKGNWLGVVSATEPNNRLVWIHRDSSKVDGARTRLSLHADLSRKTLELRRGERVVKRIEVAVGRRGSSTPTGRFAVTDKLSGRRFGAYYGCCILALNGKQPNLPAGWEGGNRLAIHGTNSLATVGKAASAGCLRARDAGLRLLMRRVPLGTPVTIQR